MKLVDQPRSHGKASCTRVQGTVVLAHIPFVVSFFVNDEWLNLLVMSFRALYGFFYLVVYLRLHKSMKTPYGRFVQKIVCCSWVGCWNALGSDNRSSGTRSPPPSSPQQDPNKKKEAATKVEEGEMDVDADIQVNDDDEGEGRESVTPDDDETGEVTQVSN